MDRTYESLKREYPNFYYHGYDLEISSQIKVTFNFEIEKLSEFHPTFTFPHSITFDLETLEVLIFNLGMVELISYWKSCCCKNVIIKNFGLTDKQARFWKKLYFNGLGEFFYLNSIETNENDFMNLIYENQNIHLDIDESLYHKVLVPIGGGKDSVVSLELIKEMKNFKAATFSINRISSAASTIKVSGLDEDLISYRTLDKNLLKLNSLGFLNGHTPFSSLVAFSSYIVAYLNGFKYIALSNESSANESTVKDSTVNHQYSKSFEFETDFNEYINNLVNSKPILYFSLLRQMNELQIARKFANYKQYHLIFRSCNVGSKEGIWCGHCPKCLFVFIILLPFIEIQDLMQIFNNENLLNKDSMDSYFKELCGISENKPFECVGTVREVLACLNSVIDEDYLLINRYRDKIKENFVSLDEVLDEFNDDNLIPKEFFYENKG